MRIGDQEITTPDEDPVCYPLDWRWRMASVLESMGNDRAKSTFAMDTHVRKLVRHLTLGNKRKSDAVPKPGALGRVIGWHDTIAGALVESFLLACETTGQAAGELGIDSDDVGYYSALFFDIRDEGGSVRPAILMRIRAELLSMEAPDMAARLRKAAITGGIAGLRRLLYAGKISAVAEEPTLDDMVENELKRRLVAGELRTGDLTRLQANLIARSRLNREEDDGKQQLRDNIRVMQNILSLTAPLMVKPDRTPEETQSTDDAIRARFEAQRNIGLTALTDDKDKGIEALNKLMNRNFSARAEQA